MIDDSIAHIVRCILSSAAYALCEESGLFDIS